MLYVASARERLGDTAWARAFARGRGLQVQAAIAEALALSTGVPGAVNAS